MTTHEPKFVKLVQAIRDSSGLLSSGFDDLGACDASEFSRFFDGYVNLALPLSAGSVQIKIRPVIELFCGELSGSLTIQDSVRWLLAAVAFSSPLQSG